LAALDGFDDFLSQVLGIGAHSLMQTTILYCILYRHNLLYRNRDIRHGDFPSVNSFWQSM
jgi:hypothetical protein